MSKTIIIDGKRYTVPDDATIEQIEAILAASAPKPMTEAETVQDIAAGASRGMAPYAAGATLGAGAGALFGGVGAAPGAAAGVAAVGAAQFLGDPLVDSVNSLFGTKFTKPTEALNQLMDAAGMAKPESEAGQLAEKVTSGAVGALSGVGAARSLAAGAAPGGFWQGVGRTMAEAPVAQVASGAAAGGAAELARQGGAGPIGQTMAGLAGGLGVGVAANTMGNFASKIGMPAPPSANMPMLQQSFDNTTNMTVRVPMQQQQRAPLPMTYEDVARDAKTAATGGMGSQQAVERLARAAPINKDAAAAAERLGIDVPPDVLMDHTQLKEAVGLTRSMPGTVASAAWSDAVDRAATQADEAMALIDGSPDLSEISDSVLNTMTKTQGDLQKQADEIYGRINARLKPAAQAAEGAPAAQRAERQVFDVPKVNRSIMNPKADLGMTEIIRNPSQSDLLKLSRGDNSSLRYFKDDAGNIFVANAYDTTHDAMVRATGQKSAEMGQLVRTADNKFDVKVGDGNMLIEDLVVFPMTGQWLRGEAPSTGAAASARPSIIEQSSALGALPKRRQVQSERYPDAPPAPKPSASVDLTNSRRLLNSVVKDLGNDVSKLTPLEKELLEMAQPGRKLPVTYTALMRMKADVGQALQRSAGPYKDVDSSILKRLYNALSEDQLAHAQKVGGDTLRADLRLANQLVAKRKALENRIVSLFGDERDGSIARKLVSTLQGGAKGDITGFNRLVKSIPQDLRKKAVASAIAAAAREEKTNGFGFSKYVNMYQGLRRNSEVYKTVATTLGPDGDKFLRDLYEVSKRITEARANVKTTGQANQALVQGLMAEGLVEGVLRKTVGSKTVMGVPIVGPIVEALIKSDKNKLGSAGDLFASPEWQQLVINVSTKQQVNQKIYNAAKNSNAFRKWAREAGITDPDQWLRSAISSTIGMGAAAKTQPYEAAMGREATE
jgi:hypothetical protein